ncbi:hypothetical protein [Paraburkholderia sp. MM6662-R1]
MDLELEFSTLFINDRSNLIDVKTQGDDMRLNLSHAPIAIIADP